MTELILLRVVHILSGVFWLGAALMNAFFLMPAVGTLGPAGGAVMIALRDRGLMNWFLASAVLTLLSGVRLFFVLAGGAPGMFVASPMGRTFAVAGVAAVLAFAAAMLLGRPSMVKVAMLSQVLGKTPEAERGALQAEIARHRKRAGVGTAINIVLLVSSAVGMAVARYM
jgi:hypothetical protein